MAFIILRLLERIIALMIGGFSIYLGYRLFLEVPNLNDVQAEVNVKEQLYINLSKIGPGAVFAGFGIVVVSLSFFKDVKFQDLENKVSFTGVSDKPFVTNANQSSKPRAPELKAGFFKVLNSIESELKPDINSRRKREIKLAISRTKLALMEANWNEEFWGDPITFRQWVEDGEIEPPPDSVSVKAIEYFRSIDR
ncbi:MAG: hypothetical protein AB4372_18225 [Xenococcus sp. (in: cyanobacteria)]